MSENNKLFAFHFLTASNLFYAEYLGGFPCPSLAICRRDCLDAEKFGFGFGNIGLIYKKLPDPSFYPVYSRDMASSRFPELFYKKPTYKDMKNFLSKINQYSPLSDSEERFFSEIVSNRKTKVDCYNFEKQCLNLEGFKILFKLHENADCYENFVRQKIELFLGEPFIAGTTKIATLKNVTEVMIKRKQAGAEEGQGLAHVMLSIAKKFSSLSALQKAGAHLLPATEQREAQERLKEAFSNAVCAISSHFEDTGGFFQQEEASKYLQNALKRDSDRQKEVQLFVNLANESAPPYYEAKITRPVELYEFETAVCLKEPSSEVYAILKKHDIQLISLNEFLHQNSEEPVPHKEKPVCKRKTIKM